MPNQIGTSKERRAPCPAQEAGMRSSSVRRPHGRSTVHWAVGAAFFAIASFAAPTAHAGDDDALKILKGMSDYLASQKTISLSFDADIEVITPEIQKIQFASSGQVLLSRPDKLRATRTGGYADVEFVFDGKTVSVLGKNMNSYIATGGARVGGATHRQVAGRLLRGSARRRPSGFQRLRCPERGRLAAALISAEASSPDSNASILRSAMTTRTGSSGSRSATRRSRANMSSPARPKRARLNTRSSSGSGRPTYSPAPTLSRSRRRTARRRSTPARSQPWMKCRPACQRERRSERPSQKAIADRLGGDSRSWRSPRQ